MRKTSLILSIFATMFGLLAYIVPAQAQATRTWVSGVGDDVNPCSRTAPCKTFAGAISKTAPSGLINCLDPGGFGAVTITKSITIDCRDADGGILAALTNGVNINGANIVVNLRGLSIEGAGSGLIGVNFIQGAVLHIDECKIFGFQGGSALGVNFAPSANAELYVTDTVVSNNGAAAGSGIQVRPINAAIARVVLDRVQLLNNTQGLRVDGAGGTGVRRVQIARSTVSGNTFQGIVGTTTTAVVSMMVNDNEITNNGSRGIQSDGAQSVIVISNNTITGNDIGVGATSSGQLFSYSTNNIRLNISSNGTSTGTLTQQ